MPTNRKKTTEELLVRLERRRERKMALKMKIKRTKLVLKGKTVGDEASVFVPGTVRVRVGCLCAFDKAFEDVPVEALQNDGLAPEPREVSAESVDWRRELNELAASVTAIKDAVTVLTSRAHFPIVSSVSSTSSDDPALDRAVSSLRPGCAVQFPSPPHGRRRDVVPITPEALLAPLGAVNDDDA
eukprot:TRINITY_DN28854_c2_g2_i1.p2 TRINITY_DN28854_c2_g2~~TRINITY_DN28854_c2_g2_i1.p2  ORF type:complete len:185 (-),score=33.53 TRINITY_DN28854_c2_g2_i1:291-845(-)